MVEVRSALAEGIKVNIRRWQGPLHRCALTSNGEVRTTREHPSSQSHHMTGGEFLLIELGLPASNPLCAELPALMDSWPLP
jgi:hypothetical protein